MNNKKTNTQNQITKATPLKKILEIGRVCARCGNCCRYGSGFLVKGDIERIAWYLKLSEKELIDNCLEPVTKFNNTLYRPVVIKNKKPYGTCIFFNTELGCTIHPVKPLQCKISTCNEYGEDIAVWFTLNYFVNPKDPKSIREWKLYLDSGGKNIPGGELEALVPDPKVLKKILSYKILK